jgi:hypothetical protein
MSKLIFTSLSALVLVVSTAFAGLNERKAQELADSAKPIAVKGATAFTIPGEYAATFDAVVKYFQKADDPVVIADRDAGLVATEIVITGGWHQTGTRTVITFIKESPSETTVKVAVTTQKRFKALQVEPWDEPVLDKEKTAVAAKVLQAALTAKAPAKS